MDKSELDLACDALQSIRKRVEDIMQDCGLLKWRIDTAKSEGFDVFYMITMHEHQTLQDFFNVKLEVEKRLSEFHNSCEGFINEHLPAGERNYLVQHGVWIRVSLMYLPKNPELALKPKKVF